MTDPSAPQDPKSRRFKGKNPQTIDLSATVVSEEESVRIEPDMPGEGFKEKLPEEPGEAAHSATPEQPAEAPPAEPERKVSGSGGKAVAMGLVFGLIGGVAGAALTVMLMRQPAMMASSPLEGRIAALETQLIGPQNGEVKDIAPRIASFETALGSASDKVAAVAARQQELDNALQAANSKVDALSQAALAAGNDTALPQLEQRLTSALTDVQTSVATARAGLEQQQRVIAPLSGRIDALGQQVTAMARQNVDPLPAVRYALTARLEQAMASGKPFTRVVDAVRKSGVAEADLTEVAAFASSGAPTAAQLKVEFREPAQAMVFYERSQSGEGFADRMIRMSEKVVRIRPRENPEANDLSSIVVRIEAALDRNSFAEAAQLWNSLPEAAKQLSAMWGKRVNERANAAAALSKLADKTVAALENSVR